MLVVETIGKVRRDYLVRKKGIKAIARDRHLSRNTVRKIIRGEETEFTYERHRRPRPRLDPFLDRLTALLEKNVDEPRRSRLTMRRIFDILQDDGYQGDTTRSADISDSGSGNGPPVLGRSSFRCGLPPARPISSIGATRTFCWRASRCG